MAYPRRCEIGKCNVEAERLLDTCNGPLSLCEGHWQALNALRVSSPKSHH